MTIVTPGLNRTAPETPRHLLEHKLRVIDARRVEVEAALMVADGSYKRQELEAELAALNAMRFECESILHPVAKPARHPALEAAYARQRQRDRAFLRTTIKQQTEQIEADAARNEAAGNHRQARILRMEIPELAERICKDFGKDPALLAEIEDT